MPRADTEAMNSHMAEIVNAVAPGTPAALVPDGAGRHGSETLIVPDIARVEPAPYGPGLGPVEDVWAHLRGAKRACRLSDSDGEIVDARCTASARAIRAILPPLIPACAGISAWRGHLADAGSNILTGGLRHV